MPRVRAVSSRVSRKPFSKLRFTRTVRFRSRMKGIIISTRARADAPGNLFAHRLEAARRRRLAVLEEQAQGLDRIGKDVIEAVGRRITSRHFRELDPVGRFRGPCR